MNSWSVYLLVVLALCFAPESSATEDYDYSGYDEVGEWVFFIYFFTLVILLLNEQNKHSIIIA